MTITIETLNHLHSMDDLIALSKAFFSEYESHHAYFFDIDELHDDDVISYFQSFIGAPERSSFVALDEDTIVGYITVYIKTQPPFFRVKRVGDISGLMVAPAYRKQRIASLLMAEAKRFFAEQGVTQYLVFTSSENSMALNLYRKQGMTDLYTTLLGEILT